MSLTPEIAAWRKRTRQQLIGRRLAMQPDERAAWSAQIEAALETGFGALAGLVTGLCWPYQGEFDARPFATRLLAQGGRTALPAVVAKGAPLEFLEWRPGIALIDGAYGLPVPDGSAKLVPDALLIPVVGVGERGDRLGYGGGFFDRTLAALTPQPLAVAIAFELSRVPSTDPQPHDVPMDFVVTERAIYAPGPTGLTALTPERCRERVAAVLAARGLPRRK